MTRAAKAPDTRGVPSLETENPVSVTAFWVLAARYADATRPRPVANDPFAERFMDEDARAGRNASRR